MRALITLISLIAFTAFSLLASSFDVTPVQTYQTAFNATYAAYPEIPRGLLEAIAYTKTRIRHVQPKLEDPSCIGLPAYHGPMGLVLNGQAWFRENARTISGLSGISIEELLANPAANIQAVAHSMRTLTPVGYSSNDPLDWVAQLLATSELPMSSEPGGRFALDTYLYSIYQLMNETEFQEAYGTPNYNLDLESFFGSNNYAVLSAGSVELGEEVISGSLTYDPSVAYMAGPCYEFSGVLWVAASSTNYSSRSGTAISAVTIHTMQGYYAGSISWFQNPVANVSAHYNMRASDGQLTQMVCEVDKAWHVGTENAYTVGIEHEGFVSDPSWYTTTVYNKSAALSHDICDDRGILELRTYFKTGTGVLGGCTRVKGHQHFPNQSHTDPGTNWDWSYFYKKVNDPVATTSYTSGSGTFYDAGGALGNYVDDQRRLYVINPSGSSPVTLNFTSFNLELNWDYIYIYDGSSVYSPLLGVYTGTSGPGTITSSSGAISVEFRSDCATVAPGWACTWSSSGTPSSCATPSGTYTGPVGWTSATINWNPVSSATDYQVQGRKAGVGSFRSLSTPLTAKWLGIFQESTSYEWKVRAYCPGIGYSAYSVLNNFTTNTLRDGAISGDLAVWPNPANQYVQIAYQGQTNLQIIDLSGKVIWSSFSTFSASNPIRVDVSNWGAGLYTVAAVSDVASSSYRFVVK
jgi:hypothetical protein